MSNFTTIKSRCQKDENNHKIWVRFYYRPAIESAWDRERGRQCVRVSRTEMKQSEVNMMRLLKKILSTPRLKRKPLISLHAMAVRGNISHSQHNTLSSSSLRRCHRHFRFLMAFVFTSFNSLLLTFQVRLCVSFFRSPAIISMLMLVQFFIHLFCY